MMNEEVFNYLIKLIEYYFSKGLRELEQEECEFLIDSLKRFYYEYYVVK